MKIKKFKHIKPYEIFEDIKSLDSWNLNDWVPRSVIRAWVPKNGEQMEKLYGEYAKEAFKKIDNLPSEIRSRIYIQGCLFNDKPPYRGVVINANDKISKEDLKILKQEIENDYVTVEVKGTAYLY